MQADVDPILRWIGRLGAGIDRARDQLVERLQLDLHDYLSAAFLALEPSTASHCVRLGGCAHGDVVRITDNLPALVKTTEGLRGRPSIND